MNGKTSYTSRSYGGFRRGVAATPSPELIGYQREQSRFDKERRLASIRERHRAKQQHARETTVALGQTGLDTMRATSAGALPETLETLERQSGYVDLGNKELPAYKHKKEIIDLIENNQASALGGETGSGKSTQMPQYLLEAGYDLVVMLEPRRIAADSLCDRVRDELADQLDDDARQFVGVIHGERVESSERDKIKVMTADTFNATAAKLEKEYAGKKVAIIADEVHEANVFTEIAIGIAGLTVRRNESWRLVAVSATQNLETLRRPFSLVNTGGKSESATLPFVEIAGRPHEVSFQEDSDKNVMEAYAALEELPEKTLLFTSGKDEINHIIEGVKNELNKREKDVSQTVEFRKIHADLTASEMSHLKDPSVNNRKIVYVATPVAMSSITIPGVTHVFTDGTINRKEIDKEGAESLVRRYLTKSEITQQIGRAGRDIDGGLGTLCKPTAIVEDDLRKKGKEAPCEAMPFVPFDERTDFAPAEIYNTNLARAVLRVANLGMFYQEINPFVPHRVEGSTISNAEMALLRIGGLDDDGVITAIGKKMDAFPLMPELARGMVEAMIQHRSALQLARMAMVAAAIDIGGIQEYNSGPQRNGWLEYVQNGASDDFMLQHDLMVAVNEIRRRNEAKWKRDVRRLRQQEDETDEAGVERRIEALRGNSVRILREHDLNPKRTERAQKVAKKCLKTLGIMMDNIDFAPLSKEEDQMLHHDFTAGMIDLVYEEVGKVHHDVYYRNIHGDSRSTMRRIRSYGTETPEHNSLIVGFPYNQRVVNKNTAEVSFKPVINRFMTVSAKDVIEFAKANHLVHYKKAEPRIEGDWVVERGEPFYGSLKIGPPEVRKTGDYVSSASRDLLVKSSLENPGKAQQLLRDVADELARYRQRIPPSELSHYRNPTEVPEITKKDIEQLVRTYAKSTRSMSELDATLAQYMYDKGIEIGRYYSNEALEEMRQRSPDSIDVAGVSQTVHYDKGTPYITAKNISRRAMPTLSGQRLYLDDGREVLLQTQHMDKKTRVSLVVYVNNVMAAQNQAQ